MDIISSYLSEKNKKYLNLSQSGIDSEIYGYKSGNFVYLKKSRGPKVWRDKTRDLIKKGSKEILFLGHGKKCVDTEANFCLVKDHVNLSGQNPLIGENDSKFGPRFFDATDLYSKELRKKIKGKIEVKFLEGSVLIPKKLTSFTELEKRILNLFSNSFKGLTQDVFAGALTAKHAGIKSAALLNFDKKNHSIKRLLSL